jgi:hypothetical protein
VQQDAYDVLIGSAISVGDIEAAWIASDRSRAPRFTELLRQTDAVIDSLSPESRVRLHNLRLRVAALAEQRSELLDGYSLDGKPEPDKDSDPNGPQSAVFVGSAAVGAMHDPKYQAFIDDAYALVATGELLARSTYYNHSWTTLSLLMLSGNLVEYAP